MVLFIDNPLFHVLLVRREHEAELQIGFKLHHEWLPQLWDCFGYSLHIQKAHVHLVVIKIFVLQHTDFINWWQVLDLILDVKSVEFDLFVTMVVYLIYLTNLGHALKFLTQYGFKL